MPEFTYESPSKFVDIIEARDFTLDNFRKSYPDAIGCAEDQPSKWMKWMLDNTPNLFWVVAKADREIVAVYVLQLKPNLFPDFDLRIISLALRPDYDQNSLYYNMNVALVDLVPLPDESDKTWVGVFPPTAALEFIRTTEFGEGIEVEPHADGLVKVTGRKPSVEVRHTEVPLAID